MINIGLTHAQLIDYFRLVWSSHCIRTEVHVLDMDHRLKEDVTWAFESGQVDFDLTADHTRDLTMSLIDPGSRLGINPDNPVDGGMYLNKMIQVWYSIAPPTRDYWYRVPVFCGPITNLDRDDVTVNVSAAGKDSLGFASVWAAKTFNKGTKVNEIISYIMLEILGEKASRWSQPKSPKTVTKDFVIKHDDVPWKLLEKLYGMLGANIFYDGNGVLQWRGSGGTLVATFTDNQILSAPKFTYDSDNLSNAIWVEGGDPKGDKKIVRSFLAAPANNPFSPQKLGRNNGDHIVGRYYMKQVSDTSIVTQAEADQRALEELNKALVMNTNAEWEGIPFPLLEEWDLYQLITPSVKSTFRFKQASLPLDYDSTMSMGYVVRKTRSVKNRRKKHHHKPSRHHHGSHA